MTTDLQQRFDAQAKTCLKLRRLIAQQENENEELLEDFMNLQWDYEREHKRAEKYAHTLADVH
ncbi:hypothetical protein GGH12_006274, partial [Coemansia sp. RSA 1822]